MFSLVDYARLFFGRLARVTIIVARKENHLKSNINNRINIFFKEKKKNGIFYRQPHDRSFDFDGSRSRMNG